MKPRYSLRRSMQAVASFSTPECLGQGYISDLSVPGCRLDTTASLRPGQTVNLQIIFTPAYPPLHIPLAVVRWVEPPWAGLEFISMSPPTRSDCVDSWAIVTGSLSLNGDFRLDKRAVVVAGRTGNGARFKCPRA